MNKKMKATIAFALVFTFGILCVQAVSAAEMFAIVLGSEPIDQTGWLSGFVVYGNSGTYTLQISANSNQNEFPITNIKIIVLVSNEAANGGIASITIEGTPINVFTVGKPEYYGPNGGPFAEPDYYGYNDQYVIPSITFNEAHWPDNSKSVTVTVTFSQTATENSKVMFLAYGTNANGMGLKTAFTNGTLFVLPEFPGPLIAVAASFVAFAVFKKIKR